MSQGKKSVFGWISITTLLFFSVFVFCFLYPLMNRQNAISLRTFEYVSNLMLLIPLLLGIFGLARKERVVALSQIGILLSSLSIAYLIFISVVYGNV